MPRILPMPFLPIGSTLTFFVLLLCWPTNIQASDPFVKESDISLTQSVLHFVTWKADQPKVWDEAIGRFEKAHPHIQIKREIAPHSSTAYHDLLTQKLKNHDSSLDVFFMDVIWPAEFAEAGWARPLDDWFSPAQQERFLPGPIRAGTYRQHIYGVPSRIDSGMLYYRLDLLKKYGFQPPHTWEELVAQANTIIKREQASHPALRGYSGQFKQYEGLVCDMMEFILSNNGSLLNHNHSLSTLTNPQTLKAVEFVRDQMIQQLASPAVLTYEEPESLAIFVQGKSVFHRNWPYAWGLANDPRHSKIVGMVGVAPLPHFPNGRSISTLGGWLYGISAYSKHPKEAWTFIQFMTSSTMQKIFAVDAALAPSRPALYFNREVLQANPQYRDFLPVFQAATPRPQTPVYPIISHIWQRFFSRVLASSHSDILQEAQRADQQIHHFLTLARHNRS